MYLKKIGKVNSLFKKKSIWEIQNPRVFPLVKFVAWQQLIHNNSPLAFDNYVDPTPTPHPPFGSCMDSFYTLSVEKNQTFFDPLPPHLVHVVIEWPPRQHS